MQTLLTAYGVNYAETMERFGYSEALYLECLEMLLHDENLSILKQAIGSGDLNAAFDAAHTLKGVAANMGLTPLAEAAGRLVEPLRRGEMRSYAPELSCLDAQFQWVNALYLQATNPSGG